MENRKYIGINIIDCMYTVLGMLLLLAVLLRYYGNYEGLIVTPDEFGYWTAASWINGYDWSSVASINAYYQYGYGVVLAVILYFFSGVQAYQVAVIVNAIIHCMSFGVLSLIIKKIINDKVWSIPLAFFICLYPSNLVYSQFSLCEVLMTFVYLLSGYVLILMCEKLTWARGVVFCLLLGILYSLHLRTVICLGLGSVFFIIQIIRNKLFSIRNDSSKKYMCLILPILFIGCMVLAISKIGNSFTEMEYSESALLAVNTYSGQVSNIKNIFSSNGIQKLLKSLIGNVWYMGTSTFLLVYVAVYTYMKDMVFVIKKKKKFDLQMWFKSYFVLCFLGAYAVSAIFTRNGVRYDSYIYGRYVEYTILPIIFLGIDELIEKRLKWKEILNIILFYLAATCILKLIYFSSSLDSVVFNTCSAIYNFMYKNYKGDFIYPSALFAILIIISIFGVINMGKYKVRYLGVGVLVSIIWVSNYTNIVEKESLKYYNSVDYVNLIEPVNNIDDTYIYFVYDKDDIQYNKTRIFNIQFLCKNKVIKAIPYQEFVKTDLNDVYMLVNKNSKCYKNVKDMAKYVEEGSPLELYQY